MTTPREPISTQYRVPDEDFRFALLAQDSPQNRLRGHPQNSGTRFLDFSEIHYPAN